MKPDIRVRPISDADVPGACRILNGIIRTGGTTAFEAEFTEARFAQLYLYGEDLIACHAALDPDGQVAGFQWIGRNDKLPAGCADIATFTRRDPPLRGTGTALFGVTCVFARDAGFGQINATIRADNVPGLGYYTKMGFLDHAIARAVPLQDATPVDRVSKRYDLKPDP